MVPQRQTRFDPLEYSAQKARGVVSLIKPIADSGNFVVVSRRFDPSSGLEIEPYITNINRETLTELETALTAEEARLAERSTAIATVMADMNALEGI